MDAVNKKLASDNRILGKPVQTHTYLYRFIFQVNVAEINKKRGLNNRNLVFYSSGTKREAARKPSKDIEGGILMRGRPMNN